MRARRVFPVLLGAVLAAAVVVGLTRGAAQVSTLKYAPRVGHAAPLFQLNDIHGRPIALQDFHGKVVLVNFFATWCIPCRHELPVVDQFVRTHKSRFTVLAVDDDRESASDIRSFAGSLGLAFAPLVDPSRSVATLYRRISRPESYWIDKQGIIRAIDYELDASTVKQRLQQLGA